MPKKDKKNAKANGGIAAAVTEHTAGKFSGSNTSSNNNSSNKSRPTSNESTPPINTPDFKPTAPDHVYSAPSPMLDALSNASVAASTAPSMTNEWARAGGLAGSPGNLISLMGDSPPTQPSSYEDAPGRPQHGWQPHRPYMSPSPASLSPPNSVRRPLSFQMEQHYQHPDSVPKAASSAAFRRSSLHSQLSPARNASSAHPPLPHQPQAHFYGAPDLDLTLTPRSGMKAGERGYYFGFDRLQTSASHPGAANDVVITGYEGGLDVYSVGKKGIQLIGSLKGLHGGVVHAKILPWTVTGDQQGIFPLVAVVLHGPVLPTNSPESANPSVTASPRLDGTASPRSAFGGHQGRQPVAEAYQTSVQVYSLQTNKLIDTLLTAPKIPISSSISLTSPAFQPPSPSGSFSIKADAGTIAVCSGDTGECWIYLQLLEGQDAHLFACVGKLWTGLQHSQRGEMTEEGDKTQGASKTARQSTSTPVFALNGRWIAYCPSAPSSQIALGAHVPVPLLGKAPGVSSLTSPHLPAATASVDLISDSFVNKIMRETTQELISGAKWVGQQGLQAWNSYWNKSPGQQPQSQPQAARTPSTNQFPPTHGSAGRPAPKEPGLVSIVDAEALATSASVTPITSFVPPQGCSFLSFAPSSLALFTASSKGDVQNVWDLLRIQHSKSSPLQATVSPNESSGPLVRQIAQFSRMTIARIVDVAWAEPHGERLAMVTERGTVHLLEMPFSAFMWPPPRRRVPVQEKLPETTETSTSAVSIATGAFGAAYQAAMPFVTRPRRASANLSPGSGTTTLKGSAAHGGRVIAAGISSSLGKTGTAINQFRHAGDHRITLPASAAPPIASCVSWVRGRKSHSLYVLGDGLVRIFPHKSRRPSNQSRRVSRSGQYRDITVPSLPDDVIAPSIRQIIDLGAQDEVLDLTDRDMDAGNNTLTLNQPPFRGLPADLSVDAAIPQAEIESSAPYQPFHTDRRVVLFEYGQHSAGPQAESLSVLLANTNLDDKPAKKKKSKQQNSGTASRANAGDAWAFGQDIPAVQLDLGYGSAMDDDAFGLDDQALPPSAMERVMQYGDQEQIVVTTRRRRTARQGDVDGDGFFEDDCEVLDFADQRV